MTHIGVVRRQRVKDTDEHVSVGIEESLGPSVGTGQFLA